MRLKKCTAITLALVLLLCLTACGGGQQSAGTGTNPGTAADAAAPQARDSVVIAIGSEPETLDPTKGWGHGNSPIVQSTLVKYTSELTFANDLATDYSLSEDGLT